MSSKIPDKSNSSFTPKLQTNVTLRNNLVPRFSTSANPHSRQKSAVQKKKLDKKNFHQSSILHYGPKDQTDSSENEISSGRPDVLSIDSDLSSNNDIGDSPVQETLFETSLNSTLKQQNVSSDITNFQKLSLIGRESSKLISADFSYCTPPRVLNDEIELEKKKGEQCAFFSPNKVRNVESASVSLSHRQRTQVVHASSPNKAGDRRPLDIDHQSTVNVQSSSRPQEPIHLRGSEAMDMKFTDLTHMQLKRSLDQIHGQNLRGPITRPYPEYIFSNGGAQSSANACFSHPINENHLPHDVASRIIGVHSNPILNGCAESGLFNQVGLATSSQSSKFDSILQVKDAMLQEKEAVILKLRLQVSSLQHQIQEGEAALRQVSGRLLA